MGKINRILMLAHPEMDHIAYMMFDGLYKILGKDNVSVYPYIRHYQGQNDEWYTLDNGSRGNTHPPSYVIPHQTPERSFDDIANNIRSFDIIYLSSARTYAVRALNDIIARCRRNSLPPIVFSEGEDGQNLDTIRRIKKKYNPVVCFKREFMRPEINNNPDIHPLYPLPFSAITDKLPPDNSNKDIDVFALFGNTHPQRENIVRLINSSHLPNKYNIHVGIDHWNNPGPNVPPLRWYPDYLGFMARAKINIISRGMGYDTLRRFEAPCFSGLVLSDNLPIETPNPFVDNHHIIYYNNDINDLVGKIENYLNNQGERERIGKAGRDHCLNYHSTSARARYFLDRIEGHI